MGSKQKDLVGSRFTQLVVTKQVESRLYGTTKKRMWLCSCDCGKEAVVNTSALTSGNTKSCGCLHDSLAGDIGRKSRHKVQNKEAGYNAVKGIYRRNATRRGLSFELKDEELQVLFSSPCYYCGILPSNTYQKSFESFVYSGIDRVDNLKGYVKDNVVSCCKVCNHAKCTLGAEEFMDWIKRVYNNIEELNK